MRVRATCLIGAITLLALPGPPAAAQAPEFDSIFERWNRKDTPGCAMGVEGGGATVFKAYGMADLEHGVPNTPDTVFEAGSVSKQFTAVAVLLLAKERLLRLDDDIRKYLPEMPDYGAKITIHHLLTHTSGVRDWGFLGNFQGWIRTDRVMTQDDVLAMLARQRATDFTPGAEFSYSNSNYVLLAIIAQRVAGKPFEALTAERIFEPLKMHSTRWGTDLPVKGRATAYLKGAQGYARSMPARKTVGDDALLTTVGDLLLWNRALSERKFGDFVAEEMERQGTLNDGRTIRYARGVTVQELRGVRGTTHGGATAGYRAWLARFPQANLSIAVLCNASDVGGTASGPGVQVATRFLPPAPPAGGSLPSANVGGAGDLADYEGLFVAKGSGLPLTLVRSGDGIKNSEGQVLVPAKGGFRMGSDLVTFESRDVLRIEDTDGNLNEYRRTEPVSTTSAQQYLGRYFNDELSTILIVEEHDGSMLLRLHGRPAQTHVLRAVYRDGFVFGRSGKTIVRFRRDASGTITGAEIGMGRVRAIRFDRLRGK